MIASGALARSVKDSLAKVGLRDVEHQSPASLSGGMKKRVALARAVIPDEDVSSGVDQVGHDDVGRLCLSGVEQVRGARGQMWVASLPFLYTPCGMSRCHSGWIVI